MSGKLDLGAVLRQSVSSSDTAPKREQIEYIDIGLLDSDDRNFYELSGLEGLAANIELCGLLDPLRVRPNPEKEGRWIVVSGHRRRAALQKLVDEGKSAFRQVPCIREQEEHSSALQELRLIYANSDTRRMTPAEIAKEAERVEALLYQLQEEGFEFPGRMRDHVAEACKVSQSKLARLKVIREGLVPWTKKLFDENAIGETLAYEIARMPREHQEFIGVHQDLLPVSVKNWAQSTAALFERRLDLIDKVECKGGGECTNRKNKYTASLKRQTWDSDTVCAKCCSKCEKLLSCKYACPGLAGKIKKLKEDRKAQQERELQLQAEKDAPTIREIQDYWTRFGAARACADVDADECWKALGLGSNAYHGGADAVMAKECLEYEFSTGTDIPYGYVLRRYDAEKLVKLADLLGCSLDYLLCRTDMREVAQDVRSAAPETAPAAPAAVGWISPDIPPADGARIIVKDTSGFVEDSAFVCGEPVSEFSATRWKDVAGWMPYPGEEAPRITGQMVFNGWMPGGTNPSDPCDVVAVFDLGDGHRTRMLAHWDGSTFRFKVGGPQIDMEPVRWMALPPEEDG